MRRRIVETYSVADRVWELSTNSDDLLASARQSFPDGLAAPGSVPDFRLHIDVSDKTGTSPWSRPICRGRDFFAFCCIADESALLFDCRRRMATGSVTRSVAGDARYWREIVFPFAVGVMSPVLNTVPLHAACFRYGGQGVLIGARSGAGKSTLAATLARRGIEFISDDWVYLTADRGLRAHGLPVPLKLLPDARRFFPELQSMVPAEAQNGEWSIAFDPAETFGAPRGYSCEPEVVILFDRVPGTESRVRQAGTEDLLDWFSEPLDCVPPCLERERQQQVVLIRALGSRRCYVVTCDGTPNEIADHLLHVCDGVTPVGAPHAGEQSSGIEHLDLLRRGRAAPHERTLEIGGLAVAVKTEYAPFLEQFAPSETAESDLQLTVLVEPEPWPGSAIGSAHQRGSVGYVSLGQDGFIAFDAKSRESAAFVTETAVRTSRLNHELKRICGKFACAAAAGQ